MTRALLEALLLGLSTLLAAILAGRLRPLPASYLRFAAALYAAMAACAASARFPVFDFAQRAAESAALLVAALGPAALAIALRMRDGDRPSTAYVTIVLLSGCLCGLAAAATGFASPSFAGLAVALAVLLRAAFSQIGRDALRAMHAAVAALALGAAALALAVPDGLSAFLLFSAAGLTGAAIACASGAGVDERAFREERLSRIGRLRGGRVGRFRYKDLS